MLHGASHNTKSAVRSCIEMLFFNTASSNTFKDLINNNIKHKRYTRKIANLNINFSIIYWKVARTMFLVSLAANIQDL